MLATGTTNIATHLYIKINGEPLPQPIAATLLESTVEQHVHLPAMFTLRFYDATLDLIESDIFALSNKIDIEARAPEGEPVHLIHGEISALEPRFNEGIMAELIVQGYDKSHALYHHIKSKTYLNVKDSDLASQFADSVQLKAHVEPTTVVYDHLYQHNQSDLSFLRQRAWRIGYECFVDGEDFYFRKPVEEKPSAKSAIEWGRDLISFLPRITQAEQVEETIVRGWDVQKKTPILGRSQSPNLMPNVSEASANPQLGKMVIVDQPVVSQAEADLLAAARMDDLGGAYIEAEGTAFRRPDIRAGKALSILGLGERLSGNYLVTSATHVYKSDGLHTYFNVTGARSGLLSDELTQASPLQKWPGVVTGIVTNTDDPNGWGRVKVKFSWMSDEDESQWARVLGIGAGLESGLCIIPDINDEVLVSFYHGDFNQPLVLGGLWNGEDKLPTQVMEAPEGEKPLVRAWNSRTGHRIVTYDNADNKMEIVTKAGRTLLLDDANGQVTIHGKDKKVSIVLDDNDNAVTIKSDDKIEIESNGTVAVKAQRDLSLEAGANFELKASGEVKIDGAMVTVTGNVIKLN